MLERHARVRRRFNARRDGARLIAATLLIGGVAACSRGPAPAPSARPNLLLVTLDTVRADRLGCYGHAGAETPALDSLARDGVRFAQAMTAAPLTLPSHATLLTGLLPPRHALHHNGAASLPDSVPTLAEVLKSKGFRTAAFVGSFVLDHRFGLDRGFELYDDEVPRDPTAATAGLEAERPGAEVVDRALAWLARDDGQPSAPRPFFAWVHLYDAHAPYEPPEPYRSRFADRLYDGEIAAVDAQVERLLAYLEESGLAANTVVAVTADHGESLGEHGELTHGLLLFEPTLRVPLLLRAPGRLPAGLVIEEPVGLVDLAPTLGALAGETLAAAGAPLDGRDLSAALAAGEEPPRVDLYAETEYPRLFGWSALQALRRGGAKYVHAPAPRLYDLRSDPGETTNLLLAAGGDDDDRRDDERRAALVAALQAVRGAEAAPAPAAAGLDAEARARLGALGYVAGATTRSSPVHEAGDDDGDGGGVETGADPHQQAGLFLAFEQAHWETLAGRPAEAASRLQPLVEADPSNAVFRAHLARAYRDAGDAASSLREYQRAFAMSPADAQVGYELALALQAGGRLAEATEVLAGVLDADGDAASTAAHNSLGVLYALQGQPEAARRQFERVVALDPRDPVALNNLGNALRDLGQDAAAIDAYQRAIDLAPAYAEPLNGLGSVLVTQQRPAEALPLFDRALGLEPGRHEIRLNRAVALELEGDRASALRAYRDFLRAAAADPDFAEQRAIATRLAARLEGLP